MDTGRVAMVISNCNAAMVISALKGLASYAFLYTDYFHTSPEAVKVRIKAMEAPERAAIVDAAAASWVQ